MKLAISVGTYLLQDYAQLNLAWLRKIFGDVPILVSDGASPNSDKISDIADRYGAYYWCDGVNAGHFQGCMANSINALAFAKENDCDFALKINQRFILVHDGIKAIIEQVFAHPHIALAMPGRADPVQLNPQSRFHASFPLQPDCIFMRVKDVDPGKLTEQYRARCANKADKYGSYTEIFWMDRVNNEYKGRWSALHCLTVRRRGWPCFFIRKAMAGPGDYMKAAQDVGLKLFNFPVSEWARLRGKFYYPMPRA